MTTLSLYSHKCTPLRIRFKNWTHCFTEYGESPESYMQCTSQSFSCSGYKNKSTTASYPFITQGSASRTPSVPDITVSLVQFFLVMVTVGGWGLFLLYLFSQFAFSWPYGLHKHTEHLQTYKHTNWMHVQQAKCTHSHTERNLSSLWSSPPLHFTL